MRLTVDTNVIFSALYNPQGASAYIFDKFAANQLDFAISVPTFLEYQDVLQRPEIREKLRLDQQQIRAILRFIADQSEKFDIAFLWRPNLRDEADNMFVELAVRSQSQFLVTANIRDFTIENQLQFAELKVVTPREFVLFWRKNNE